VFGVGGGVGDWECVEIVHHVVVKFVLCFSRNTWNLTNNTYKSMNPHASVHASRLQFDWSGSCI
jgi:hypothetical protein